MKYETEIPEGVNVVVSDKALSVTGPLGKLERNFAHIPLVSFTVKDNKVMIETPRARKQDKMFLNTSASHVRNLIEGVTKGYKYTLEIVHVHFPMRLAVQGKDIVLENFLGSKVPRKTQVFGDVTVKVKGKEVTVEGLNKEQVGQTSASLEKLTRIKGKDRRVFRDGIYLVKRGNINE